MQASDIVNKLFVNFVYTVYLFDAVSVVNKVFCRLKNADFTANVVFARRSMRARPVKNHLQLHQISSDTNQTWYSKVSTTCQKGNQREIYFELRFFVQIVRRSYTATAARLCLSRAPGTVPHYLAADLRRLSDIPMSASSSTKVDTVDIHGGR